MRNSIFVSALALLLSATAANNLRAEDPKSASDLRVYINPGHGSWFSNDRPLSIMREVDGVMTVVKPGTSSYNTTFDSPYGDTEDPSSCYTGVTPPDTTAFYETNTNLRKGLAMLDKLEEYGLKIDRTLNQDNENKYRVGAALDLSNNLVMSHVMAGPYPYGDDWCHRCNRNVSEIAIEVFQNNFDAFVSMHSNATNSDLSNTNYLVFMYRGYTNQPPMVEGSLEMIQCCWPYQIANKHQPWTSAYSSWTQGYWGDISYMGGGSTNSTTGAYGGLGVLKHYTPGFLVEGYFHTYSPSRHRAMQFDTDRIEGYAYARGIADYFGLEKEKTGDIYGVVRDKNEKFTAEYYVPNVSTDDVLLPINGITVILSDAQGNEIQRKVTDNHYNGAFVFHDLEPGDYVISFESDKYMPVSFEEDTHVTVEAATTSFVSIGLDSVEYYNAKYVEPDVNYPDPLDTEDYHLDAAHLEFEADYADATIEPLTGLNVRRQLVKGDNVYVLGVDAQYKPTIMVYDGQTCEVKANVSTTTTEGDYMPIGDIYLTTDGFLVAINCSLQPSGRTSKVKVYKWAKDEETGLPSGNPEEWISWYRAGNWKNSEFGKTLCYDGSVYEGWITFSAVDEATGAVALEVYSVENQEFQSRSRHYLVDASGEAITDAQLGDFQLLVSPFNEDNVIVSSQKALPMEVKIARDDNGDNATILGQVPAELIKGTGFRSSVFKYAGRVMMACPQGQEANEGVALLDITDGLSKATLVNSGTLASLAGPAEASALVGEVSNVSTAGTPGVCAAIIVNRNDDSSVLDYKVNLYLTRGDAQLSKITAYVEAPQPEVLESYEFNKLYTDQQLEGLEGLNVRRTLTRNGLFYVLAVDSDNEPTINVYSTADLSLLANVDTKGTEGSVMKIADIALTDDNFLLGINCDNQPFGGSNIVNIYIWKNDELGIPTDVPRQWINYNHAGNWNNGEFGKSLTYYGDSDEGYAIFSTHSQASGAVVVEIYNVLRGGYSGYTRHYWKNASTGEVKYDATLGEFQYLPSPFGPDHLIVTSQLLNVYDISMDFANDATNPVECGQVPAGVMTTCGLGGDIFTYGDATYLVSPKLGSEGKNVGLELIDITKGLPQAAVVVTGTDIEPIAVPTVADNYTGGAYFNFAAAGTPKANGGLSRVNGVPQIDLYLVRGDAKISRFSTGVLNENKYVNGIQSVNYGPGATTVKYFNLQGMLIANPTPGQLVIKVSGTHSEKIIF